MEREVRETRDRVEEVRRERERVEAEAAAEMVSLEESWRRGVRGLVEVQVARGELMGEVLRRRRAAVE